MAKITFNQIAIENFGPFKEKQTLCLESQSSKPVILIEALNGSGKTTLLTALQIGLYGDKAVNSIRRSEYERLVSGLMRNDADGKASIEITLSIEIGEKIESVLLSRQWEAYPSLSERFLITQNGEFNSEFTENWDEFINGILPVELVQLFLFDGEKIEALANPEKLPQLLRRATEVFLGLGGLDLLSRDLKALERRAALKNKDDAGDNDKSYEQIEILEKNLDELAAKRDILVQRLAEARNDLERAQKDLHTFSAHAQLNGIDSFKKAAELKSNFEIANNQYVKARHALAESLEDPLVPILWLGRFWDQYKEQNELDSNIRKSNFLVGEFEKRNTRLLKSISDQINPDALSRLTELLEGDVASLNQYKNHKTVLINDVNLTDIQHQLEAAHNVLKQRLKNVETTATTLNKMEHLVAQIPAEEQLSDIFDELQAKSKSVAICENKIQDLQQKIEELTNSCTHVENRLSSARLRAGGVLVDHAWQVKSHESGIRAKKALALFRDKLLASKSTWLSELITSEFKKLLHKQKLVSKVIIDPTSYAVSIEDISGNILPIERLSAGERQILAIAVLSALISNHKNLFPVVVDTPMARLDSNHRESLINNFFTRISHQVLVLSTDKEVDTGVYKIIRPFISKEYILSYDNETRSSTASTRQDIKEVEIAL